MKTCVILNPQAGTADRRDRLERLFEIGAECIEVTEEGDGSLRARDAAARGMERIIVAGGDGTLNEVVNGIAGRAAGVVIGVYPMGTGNDTARTLGIPLEPDLAIDTLLAGRTERIDLIAARTNGDTIFGVNAAAGGFSGQVDENMSSGMKATWGTLAYLLGAASTLSELQPYDAVLHIDDQEPERVEALNVIVANGRTVGGGKRVAPMANPQDGVLDVVVVRFGPMTRLAEVAARLVAGDYTESDYVFHRRARRVAVTSEPGMWFNIDGELITQDAISFDVMPNALSMIVGEDYSPVPPADQR